MVETSYQKLDVYYHFAIGKGFNLLQYRSYFSGETKSRSGILFSEQARKPYVNCRPRSIGLYFLTEGENINLMLTLAIVVDPVLEFECIYNK